MFILFDWRFYRICGGKYYERHVTYVTVRKLTIVNRVGISKRKRQMSSELFGTFHLNSAKGPLGHTQSSPVLNKTHYTRWKVHIHSSYILHSTHYTRRANSANDIFLHLLDILTLWCIYCTVYSIQMFGGFTPSVLGIVLHHMHCFLLEYNVCTRTLNMHCAVRIQ